MSCSGETVEVSNDFIQIKPMILDQLKKAKYGKMKRIGMNWAALPRPSEGTRSTAWRRVSAVKVGSDGLP